MRPTLTRIDTFLIRWARRKFKRLYHRTKGARDWFVRLRRATPTLFAHWRLGYGAGRTSGAVRIESSCTVLGARGGAFLRATRHSLPMRSAPASLQVRNGLKSGCYRQDDKPNSLARSPTPSNSGSSGPPRSLSSASAAVPWTNAVSLPHERRAGLVPGPSRSDSRLCGQLGALFAGDVS